MNIKEASKTVNEELKKLKTEVGQWHLEREKIFNNLKTAWVSSYDKTLNDLKTHKDSKDILIGLKNYEKHYEKVINDNTKKLLELNTQYSVIIKNISKNLGELANPYLKTVKETSYGINLKSQRNIEEDLSEWIENECISDIDSVITKSINKLNKKMFSVTKNSKNSNLNEKEHLLCMAQLEDFTKKMLIAFEETITLPKSAIKFVQEKQILSNLVYELKITLLIEKIDKTLQEIENGKNSNVDFFIESYGNSSDPESFKRSQLALKGVKACFSEFKNGFKEMMFEDFNDFTDFKDFKHGVLCLYLNDTLDHLNLAKSCLVNDVLAMNQFYDMDTASRDLISDSLHDYFNSDEFEDMIKQQKKSKKMKM